MPTCNCNQQGRPMRPYYKSQEFQDQTLAMAYVPWQQFDKIYEIDKALEYGTIFPELNKVFCGKRGVQK